MVPYDQTITGHIPQLGELFSPCLKLLGLYRLRPPNERFENVRSRYGAIRRDPLRANDHHFPFPGQRYVLDHSKTSSRHCQKQPRKSQVASTSSFLTSSRPIGLLPRARPPRSPCRPRRIVHHGDHVLSGKCLRKEARFSTSPIHHRPPPEAIVASCRKRQVLLDPVCAENSG